jgi:Uma2 family endonuclease
MSAPAVSLHSPFTVDDLFDMPDDGNRYEVYGGTLNVSPSPAPTHQVIVDELRFIFRNTLGKGSGVWAHTNLTISIPDENGLIPDIAITTTVPTTVRRAFDVADVHTVVEVVSPSNALIDRSYKRDLYAEAGIPCYWRVEPRTWRGYLGPVPLIIVRLREDGAWRTVEAAAGTVTELPLAIGPKEFITVALDPGELVEL